MNIRTNHSTLKDQARPNLKSTIEIGNAKVIILNAIDSLAKADVLPADASIYTRQRIRILAVEHKAACEAKDFTDRHWECPFGTNE